MRNLTMKTKLAILAGGILTVLSVVAVAGDTLTSPWSKELSQVQQTPTENTVEDVSILLPSLQGIPAEESAYLDDDMAIYVSRPNDLNERTSRRKVADNVKHLFSQHVSKVLFTKKVTVAGMKNGWSADLWILDTQTGKEKKISASASLAVLSPSGEFIAVDNSATGNVELFTGEGMFLKKIEGYGFLPLFSPDSKKIAYYKFASSAFLGGSPYDPIGIAIYNIETGEELLATNNNEGGKPVAFSADGKNVYFNSIRTSKNSLGIVNISSHEVKKLSGSYDWRYFSVKKDVLISSDEKAMVSSSENGVGVIIFNNKGEISSTKIVTNGTNPRWLKKDEIIAYRATGNKGKYWEFAYITK